MIPAARSGGPWEDGILTDESLRILLVIENAGAGSGRHVVDLARGLVGRGHAVVLLYGDERLEPWFEEELAVMDTEGGIEAGVQRPVSAAIPLMIGRIGSARGRSRRGCRSRSCSLAERTKELRSSESATGRRF